MRLLSTYQQLSEQDYGPWLDRVSLFEINGQFYLQEEYGYSRPYSSGWYLLDELPRVTLEKAFGEHSGLWTGHGDTGEFEHELGVGVTRCADPRPLSPGLFSATRFCCDSFLTQGDDE